MTVTAGSGNNVAQATGGATQKALACRTTR